MNEHSVTLSTRSGRTYSDPTAEIMCAAIDEVRSETVLNLPGADLAKYPDARMKRAWRNGKSRALLLVDVYRSGDVIVSRWADQDDAEPTYQHRLGQVSVADCLILWCLAAEGAEAVLLHRIADLR